MDNDISPIAEHSAKKVDKTPKEGPIFDERSEAMRLMGLKDDE